MLALQGPETAGLACGDDTRSTSYPLFPFQAQSTAAVRAAPPPKHLMSVTPAHREGEAGTGAGVRKPPRKEWLESTSTGSYSPAPDAPQIISSPNRRLPAFFGDVNHRYYLKDFRP